MFQSEFSDYMSHVIWFISINFLSKSVVILVDKINSFLKDLETFAF